MTSESRRRRYPRAVWVAAGSSTLALLATAARYGFHRDELYFIVAGRHLDWGYVDQPPLTPLVARIAEVIVSTSPFALRILPALAVGTAGLLAAAMARRLGGGATAQVFAAFSVSWAGVVLGEGHLLSTAVFDFLLWTVALWLVVQLLDGADPRLWLAVGATVGVGMQNKYTIGFLAAAIVVGIALTAPRRLAGPLPWIGGAIAVVIWLPNLVWQINHDWPQLEMAEALRSRSDGPLAFVLQQPLLLSISLAVPAAVGWWWLARSPRFRPWRSLAVAYALLFAFFLVSGGKSYYIAPMYSSLLAAGALWFEELSARARRVMGVAAVGGVVIGVLIALPLLPPASMGSLDATGELGETVGWPELVDQVAAVVDSLPADERAGAVIITSNYGEAGALQILGRERDLPDVTSGHNSYWLWGPPEHHGAIIAVGPVGAPVVDVCPQLEMVGTITNPWDVENEEAGYPLSLCRQPTRQLAEIWDAVRHYS